MSKAFDQFAGMVPKAVSSTGTPARPVAGGRRRDRPLGKQGLDLLASVPLFAELPKRHLRKLAEHADLVEFRPRETIVAEGMRGGAFFVIVEGEAKVLRKSRTMFKLTDGDFFGELALLDGGIRSASVVATTPMLCIRIFKRAFDRLLVDEPSVAATMLSGLAARLRQAERPRTD